MSKHKLLVVIAFASITSILQALDVQYKIYNNSVVPIDVTIHGKRNAIAIQPHTSKILKSKSRNVKNFLSATLHAGRLAEPHIYVGIGTKTYKSKIEHDNNGTINFPTDFTINNATYVEKPVTTER